jgi:hypothetical protein
VTDDARLERRYRRLLRVYPGAFRRHHGEEILAVLLAGAHDGQRRPGPAAWADLIMSGLRIRLSPSVPPSARPVRAAVRLMQAGAVVTVLGLVAAIASLAAARPGSAALRVAGHSQALPVSVTVGVVLALAEVVVWLWMAWANSQGRNWARVASTVLVGAATLHLFGNRGVVQVAFALLTWSLGLAAVCLLWRPGSAEFFTQDGQREPVGSS